MIPLSTFIEKIVTSHRWFRIKAYTKDNEQFEVGSSEIQSFYNNIMIEKMLSRNFKKIELKVSYKFSITHGHEFVNNESITLIKLYNLNNRVYVKEATLILYKKNINFESMILDNLCQFENTDFKIVCLEREMIRINKLNRNRPYKIKDISVSLIPLPYSPNDSKSKSVSFDYEKYNFDTFHPLYVSIQTCFCYKTYQKTQIQTNNIFESIENFSKMIGSINDSLYNKNKTDLLYLKKYMVAYNHSYKDDNKEHILFDIKSNDLSKLPYQVNNLPLFKNKSNFLTYTAFALKLAKFIKNNENVKNNMDYLNFYKLIKLFMEESKKRYYEKNGFKKIDNEIGQVIIDYFRNNVLKKIDFDDYSIIIIFNFNKKSAFNFKFSHLLYDEELENEIEKRLYSSS